MSDYLSTPPDEEKGSFWAYIPTMIMWILVLLGVAMIWKILTGALYVLSTWRGIFGLICLLIILQIYKMIVANSKLTPEDEERNREQNTLSFFIRRWRKQILVVSSGIIAFLILVPIYRWFRTRRGRGNASLIESIAYNFTPGGITESIKSFADGTLTGDPSYGTAARSGPRFGDYGPSVSALNRQLRMQVEAFLRR